MHQQTVCAVQEVQVAAAGLTVHRACTVPTHPNHHTQTVNLAWSFMALKWETSASCCDSAAMWEGQVDATQVISCTIPNPLTSYINSPHQLANNILPFNYIHELNITHV